MPLQFITRYRPADLRRRAWITNQRKIANTFKRGAAMLNDPAMDAVCAAANVGCFATYILRQGGVLIPREDYVVRQAYQPAEEMNAYCEIPDKVFGVWSPHLGEDSRICTRLVKWAIRAKSKVATEAKSGLSLGGPFAVANRRRLEFC